MKGSKDTEFKNKLKSLIIKECELDVDINSIDDDAPIFGKGSQLELDSIDALQIATAVQDAFGITITDSKVMRKILESINTFADYLQPG